MPAQFYPENFMKIGQAVQKLYHYSKFKMAVGSHLEFVNLHHISTCRQVTIPARFNPENFMKIGQAVQNQSISFTSAFHACTDWTVCQTWTPISTTPTERHFHFQVSTRLAVPRVIVEWSKLSML